MPSLPTFDIMRTQIYKEKCIVKDMMQWEAMQEPICCSVLPGFCQHANLNSHIRFSSAQKPLQQKLILSKFSLVEK